MLVALVMTTSIVFYVCIRERNEAVNEKGGGYIAANQQNEDSCAAIQRRREARSIVWYKLVFYHPKQ